MHCNWSNPSTGKVNGKDAVFFAGGDGVLYAFDTKFEKDEDGFDLFKALWKYDCNPEEYKKDEEGNEIKYPAAEGPSELIATPTFHNGYVYVAIGQILSMEKDLAISYVLMLIPVKRFGTIARFKELSPPAQLTRKVGF